MKNAIFIVGCPNSGKDILIKDVCEKFCLEEYTFKQAKKYLEKGRLSENILVKGNAYETDEIFSLKEILEERYYTISLIYVDIEEDTLYRRNINIDECKKEKFNTSKNNIQIFEERFDNFLIFDNNLSLNESYEHFVCCENFVFSILDPISFIKEKTNGNIKDYVYKNFNLDKEEKKKKIPKNFYSHSTLKPDSVSPEYDIRTSGSTNISTNSVQYTEDIGSPETLMTSTGMSFSNRDDYPIHNFEYTSVKKKKTSHPNFNSPSEKPVWKRVKQKIFRDKK